MVEVFPYADEADEQRGLDLFNAVWPHERLGLDEERSYRASLRDHTDLLARIDGTVGGFALGAIRPERPNVVFALVTVLAELRHRGAGIALYAAISDWARERGLDTIETIVADDDPESLAFALRRGFIEDSHELGVSLDLRRIEPPIVEPPEGVQIVTWAERPELARRIYEVWLEAIPDIPGAEDEQIEPFEDWLAHDMRGPGDRPEATFVAVANDEAIGFAKFSLTSAQPLTAHHDLTGVKRAWRGRGVARALKAKQIAWAKENGYEELRTTNEERNAPIRRLNQEFGYRPSIGRIFLKGPLASSEVIS
ncbi:MAG TPA: GNAT family N-acetyltransferase [Actinomycetota bacterium]|nr:GNAT family N-acetyltransferase [Actinomycetota bacterium]